MYLTYGCPHTQAPKSMHSHAILCVSFCPVSVPTDCWKNHLTQVTLLKSAAVALM